MYYTENSVETHYLLTVSTVLQHDSGIECTPGESRQQQSKERGNYIMYARATSGDKLNNNRFSICSIRNITAVLTKKRDYCFVGKFLIVSIYVAPLCVRVTGLEIMFSLRCVCVHRVWSAYLW